MHSSFNPKQETPEAPFINFEYLLLFKGFNHLQAEFSQGLDVGNPPPFHNFKFSKEKRKRTYTEWCDTEGKFVDYDEKFEDYLQKYLDRWKHNGLQIINKHLKEISNDSMVKQYLVIQLRKIEELKSSLSPERHQKNPMISEKLNGIEHEIKTTYDIILKKVVSKPSSASKNSGFGYDGRISFLITLYNLELEGNPIIDKSKTTKEDFIKVFGSTDLSDISKEHEIHFCCGNKYMTAFIYGIEDYFPNLNYTEIEKSELFYCNGKPFHNRDITTKKRRYELLIQKMKTKIKKIAPQKNI